MKYLKTMQTVELQEKKLDLFCGWTFVRLIERGKRKLLHSSIRCLKMSMIIKKVYLNTQKWQNTFDALHCPLNLNNIWSSIYFSVNFRNPWLLLPKTNGEKISYWANVCEIDCNANVCWLISLQAATENFSFCLSENAAIGILIDHDDLKKVCVVYFVACAIRFFS